MSEVRIVSLSATCKSKAELRRRRVIDVARTLFAERGFHATGIAQIARDSGILVGQLYRDFACKEDIIASIVEQDCLTLIDFDGVEATLADCDAEAIRAWIHRLVHPDDSGTMDHRIFAEIIAESARNARMMEIFQSGHERMRSTLCLALSSLIPGEHNADERWFLAEIILSLAVGLLQRPITDDARNAGLIERVDRLIDSRIRELADAPAG